jgi:hypothetical protein
VTAVYGRLVLGFVVTLADGSLSRVDATHYEVPDDGSLVVFADNQIVFESGPGSWIAVQEVGTRLAATWPPETLDRLLDDLHWKLCVGYGHCGALGPAPTYESGLLNELDTLSAEVLQRVGIDPDSSTNRDVVFAVRTVIGQHFGVPIGSSPRTRSA